MYQLLDYGVARITDGVSIPPDPANSDYAEYLAWIGYGNTPLPPKQPSVAELLASAKDELRALRKPILDAVNGIGWRASMTGNMAVANEALASLQRAEEIASRVAPYKWSAPLVIWITWSLLRWKGEE